MSDVSEEKWVLTKKRMFPEQKPFTVLIEETPLYWKDEPNPNFKEEPEVDEEGMEQVVVFERNKKLWDYNNSLIDDK